MAVKRKRGKSSKAEQLAQLDQLAEALKAAHSPGEPKTLPPIPGVTAIDVRPGDYPPGAPSQIHRVHAAVVSQPPPAPQIPTVAPPVTEPVAAASMSDLTQRTLKLAEDLMTEITTLRALAGTVEIDKRARFLANCTNQVDKLGKLLGLSAEVNERKILQTPAWRRIEHEMLSALEPWPEAMRAVGERLKAMGG